MARPYMWLFLTTLVCPVTGSAQQVADTTFRFPIRRPTYQAGTGPTVCIDGAHNNFHTIDGRYSPFATLVRGDGFVAQGVDESLTSSVLDSCAVLVIANAVDDQGGAPALVPRRSPFTAPEVDEVIAWIRSGGSLLLIADHAPYPSAVRDLAALLGFHLLNGFAAPTDSSPGAVSPFGDVSAVAEAEWFAFGEAMGLSADMLRGVMRHAGSLGDHPVIRGREGAASVRLVVAFQGQAFQSVPEADPLLVWGPDARAAVIVGRQVDPTEWPVFEIGGWLAGAARTYGQGRVVMLGEAAMCSAQIAGGRLRAGMNATIAPDNARFCLNAVRWLAGAL